LQPLPHGDENPEEVAEEPGRWVAVLRGIRSIASLRRPDPLRNCLPKSSDGGPPSARSIQPAPASVRRYT
jgi:hypothetical protein